MRRSTVSLILVSVMIHIIVGCSFNDNEPETLDYMKNESLTMADNSVADTLSIDKELSDSNTIIVQPEIEDETEALVIETDITDGLEDTVVYDLLVVEKELNEVNSLEELINLFEPRMDGAYGYGYISELFEYYRKTEPYEFVNTLSNLDNHNDALMIAKDMSSGVYGLDENMFFTGAFSTDICKLLSSGNLSQKQVEISEALLSCAPDIVQSTTYDQSNVFGSSIPVLWYCPDGEIDNYALGCSWYCAAIVPDIYTTSTLSSRDGRFNAVSAYDFNLNTAWSEGVEGHGIGEAITIVVPGNQDYLSATSIEIINGYIKSDAAWEENSRVKKLAVSVDDMYIGDLQLEDSKEVQRFEIGVYPLNRSSDLKVILEILEVYKGSKYEDTLITELTLDGIGDH